MSQAVTKSDDWLRRCRSRCLCRHRFLRPVVIADPMIQSKSAPFELINKNVYKYALNSATLVIVVVTVFIKYAFQIRLGIVVFSVVAVGALKSSSDFSDFNDVLNVL